MTIIFSYLLLIQTKWKPIYYFVASFTVQSIDDYDNRNNRVNKKKEKGRERKKFLLYSYHVAISNVSFFPLWSQCGKPGIQEDVIKRLFN